MMMCHYVVHLTNCGNLDKSCTMNVFGKVNRHVNATKSYLHFDRFAGEAILCSNFFCFSLFLDVLFLS